MPRPPIIIIGMHRSGTSMITRALEELGLFMGHEKQGDDEAVFFLTQNRKAMLRCGATWDEPDPFPQLLLDRSKTRRVVERFRASTESAKISTFLGPRFNSTYETLLQLEMPWGWKDPRTTFTLPIWLEVFPNARVIHIYRHGVDVTGSLMQREKWNVFSRSRLLLNHTLGYSWPMVFPASLYQYGLHMGLADVKLRPSTTAYFELWAKYTETANELVRSLGSQALEVRYESFLKAPQSTLEELIKFCDIEASREEVASAAGKINAGRAYAYQQNEELRNFAKQVEPQLKAFNYNS